MAQDVNGHALEPTKRIGLCLLDQFALFSFAAFIEPMRALNRRIGWKSYEWILYSMDGEPVNASNGVSVAVDRSLNDLERLSAFYVLGGLVIDPQPTKKLMIALRKISQSGTPLGAISSGTFSLARAGLLEGYRCTVHWENQPAFEDAFPDIQCTGRLYEIDRDRMTCSGGIASMDLMLRIIREDHGRELADTVANQFQLDRIRNEPEAQRGGAVTRLTALPPKLRLGIELMNANLEEPLQTSEIARLVDLSVRQVERLFLRYVGCSPAKYYTRLRLERARELILHTNQPIVEIAVATGFTSNSYFAHCYRSHFGLNPSAVRRGER